MNATAIVRNVLTPFVLKSSVVRTHLHSYCRSLSETRVSRRALSTKSSDGLSLNAAVSEESGSNPSLIISDNCVTRLKRVADANEFLRVEVESGGCSGFQYKFKLDSCINEDDKVFEKDGVKVVVDSVSIQFIQGSVIDYNEELIRSSFQITNNPKAEHGCSCGASFTVKI
ncbi:iron-sulfur cluster assembly 2: mitochondrial-like isoform X1 [Dinothrombium tinctorium]|uniref:Iron-sulfur cluster assembly 2 homolog, mitochondrial n=1 Tax=Dinothrombium tinctorium TaxID=1965070 RepID=A0A3S3NX63_9ACAR|nr:iron-sulfur cluster assembly 2: mitochondrial-like isoform X1 [Dinothrombium tinctorium]RWS03289.1 iron-sulfur cluster assembly 2: mitochondrial-like isoform X1 [Dinothrombium tinctorium]RWS03588.1 iron-sulfur cluster assembly 2: mitochondrial-like isoform X1 [Dinothrombium tinctorium]RWS03593.1 iron-sulfur cluster assembly 2: mitochondrial-like isoform X1 [Dinothrombium tinctorium]